MPVKLVTVIVEDAQLFATFNVGATGMANGAAFTLLLAVLVHDPIVCVTVILFLAVLKVLGFPEPPSFQISVPVNPDAVITEFPQLLTTVSAGAAGIRLGAAFTLLLAVLTHDPMVCVTVMLFAAVLKVLGLPEPPSLQVSVPVYADAVITELPQLFTTVSTGEEGIVAGAAFTLLLAALVHDPMV